MEIYNKVGICICLQLPFELIIWSGYSNDSYFCLTRAFYCLKVIFVVNVNFCALLEVEAINKPWYFNVWIISQELTTTTGGSDEESGCFTEGTVKEFQLGLMQSWYKCNWSLCSFQKPIGLIQLCYNFKTLPLTFKLLSVKDLKESRFFFVFSSGNYYHCEGPP